MDAPNTSYGTPLQVAARWADVDLTRLLIAKGVNVNAVSGYGETALHTAAAHGEKAIAEILIAHGANVNALTTEGQTPLDFAYRGRDPDSGVVQLLTGAGGQEGRALRKGR